MEKNKMQDQNNLNVENMKSAVTTPRKPIGKSPIKMGALVVTIVVAVLLIALSGCGNKIDDIAIKEDAMPQSVFILGEDIDLSSGILVIYEDGKETEIAMNDEGVSVSGFDKNTLGEQTITVHYKDKSVDLTVTVVERMQVVDFTADYLVGDTLDLSAGRLKITRDDGSNYTIALMSNKVTVNGFDSQTAGTKNLAVSYASGSETYTASFSVNVHNVEKITLTPPTKVTYNSHDEGIDVTGGILNLSALNGKVKRDVVVTEDMIEGFDLSAAKGSQTPYKQTVNVVYDGKSYPYTIVIKYTAVSRFKDNASIASDFTWSGEDVPEIAAEDGEIALELMRLYFDMSPAEQSLLTREETINMARVAMIYGFKQWGEDIYEFEGAFTLVEGAFEIECVDRASVEAAIEKLQVTDRPIYTLYDVINGMVTTFKEEKLFTFTDAEFGDVDMYFSEYPTVDPEFFTILIDVFEYMLDLDDLMDAVGDDWFENINDYAQEIEAVYDGIVNSDFYSYEYSQFFYYVSMWRPNDDAFDFLYYYYYEVKSDVASIISIANIRLPSGLESIFAHLYEAMSQLDALANYMVTDTTQFFYHYHMACKLSQELLASEAPEDEMNQVLFYGLPLNSMLGIAADELYTFDNMISYLSNTQNGYYPLCGALLDLPEFNALMEKYLEIITRRFEEEEYELTDEYAADVKAMLALYMELTPSQQFSFLGTLNAFYSMSIPPLAFDNTGDYAELVCIFVEMVNSVYADLFETKAGKDAYLALMLATEVYTQRFTNETWLETFRANMKVVADALAGTDMSAADKATFESELKTIYNDYCTILAEYAESEDSTAPEEDLDLGEWADQFAALEEAILGVEFAYQLLEGGYPMYDIFFTAFERAQRIADEILSTGSDKIKDIFIHKSLYSLSNLDRFLDPETPIDPETEIFWSYDYVLSVYRSMYVNMQVSIGGGIYDQYKAHNMGEFMNEAYDLIWALMWSSAEDTETEIFDKEKVISIMESFYKMDLEAQMIFILYIEGEYGMYYESLFTFLKGYSDAVEEAVTKLIDVEMSAIAYNYYVQLNETGAATDEDLAQMLSDLQTAYTAFEKALTAVDTDEEIAEFADFNNVYEYYKTLVEGINANVEANA